MTRSTGPVKMILQGKEKEGEGKVDKKRDWKTTYQNGPD